ncbi:MAG: sigma-70 family RNA polymerase sigma factor [Gemmataceae bacterium]
MRQPHDTPDPLPPASPWDQLTGPDGRRRKRAFLRWAANRRISAADAEDAISRTLAAACVRIDRGEDPGRVLAPGRLFLTAMRYAVRHRKGSAKFRPLGVESPANPAADRQQDLRRAKLDAVAFALRQLAEQDRLLLTLSFSEGMSQADIGLLYGVPQPVISRRIRAALGRARNAALVALARDGYEPELFSR